MKTMIGRCVASLALAAASSAFAINYYVSPAGNDANNGLSTASPMRSLQTVANLTNPGDTVYLMSGTFVPQTTTERNETLLSITRSGTPSAWIRYTAAPSSKPVLKGSGSNVIKMHGGASYIEISNLEIAGENATLTLAGARAQPTGPTYDPKYNTNGITIDGRNDGTAKPHHIKILNNHVHDLSAAGIACIQCDYVTIDHNIVYNTSWYTIWATSGISVWQAWNYDSGTGYRIFITNNESFGNKTQVNWVATHAMSDGNGIIWDDSKNTQNRSRLGPYNGRVLIANNISYNNGGSGIHSYMSEHADIVNNTTYQNGQVVGYPEISAGNSNDIRVINNIISGRSNAVAVSSSVSTNVVFDYNVLGGGEPWVIGANDVEGNPLFVNPSADPRIADFHLQSGSVAVNRGLNQSGLTPPTDIEGTMRPQAGYIDRGAYESDFTGASPTGLASIILEAEEAVRSGPAVSTSGGRYFGTGFTHWEKNSGAYIQFSFNMSASSTRKLKIRYANGGTSNAIMSVSINGGVVAPTVTLPPTGGANAFAYVSVPAISLPAGVVTLRLTQMNTTGSRVDTLALFE